MSFTFCAAEIYVSQRDIKESLFIMRVWRRDDPFTFEKICYSALNLMLPG